MLSGRKFKYEVLQDAAGATGAGSSIQTLDPDGDGAHESLVLQLTGTFTATVTFQATVDGTNWADIGATKLTDGSVTTTATAAGLFRINTLGLSKVRANVTAYTDGNVTVTAQLAA